MAKVKMFYRGMIVEYDDTEHLTEESAKAAYDEKYPRDEDLQLVSGDRRVDPRTESEGTFQEIAEGVASGATKAVQGVAELGASGIDFVFDTNTVRAVDQAGEDLREYLGLDPVGLPAEIAEIATQFVIPGLGGVGLVSKASKIGKLNRSIREAGRGRVADVGPMPAALTTKQKAIFNAQQAGAALVFDAAVATDGTTTIGDFVEGGPTLTEKDIGLSGGDEALRRLRNKLRVGGEAGAVALGFPYLLSGTALAARPALSLTGTVLASGAKNTREVFKNIAEATGNTRLGQAYSKSELPPAITRGLRIDPDSTAADVVDGVKAKLRFRGDLSLETARAKAVVQGGIDSEANQAAYAVRKLERNMKKVFKRADSINLKDFGPLTKIESMNALYGFLTRSPEFLQSAMVRNAKVRARRPVSQGGLGRELDVNNLDDLATALPDFLREPALLMRNQIDNLSIRAKDSAYLKALGEEGMPDNLRTRAALITQEIEENLGKYLRRQYRVFDDPKKYFDSAEFAQTRQEVFQFLLDNPNSARNLYNKFVDRSASLLEPLADDAAITPDIANTLIESFLKKYKNKTGFFSSKPEDYTRVATQRLRRDVFQSKTLDDEVLMKLLGEIRPGSTQPRALEEAFVRTVGSLAETVAVDNFQKFLLQGVGRMVADPAQGGAMVRIGGEDIVDGNVIKQMGGLGSEQGSKYVQLKDPGFGALAAGADVDNLATQYYARRPVFNDLTRALSAEAGTGRVLSQIYSGFLRGKGFAQKVKTVYSPITQVRNVTSAALFALANGNVGRGANVYESVALVLENIRKSSPENRAAYFRELQELGVLGTQAQLRELERIIETGFDKANKIEVDELGVDLAQKSARRRGAQFLSSIDKRLRDLYQGGDDIWKIYNFDFERSKLINAFGGDVARAEKFATDQGFKSLNQYAAEIVNSTVPNYERVPEAIKAARKLPLGNFIAFPAEILRTSANALNRSIDEVQLGQRMIDAGEVEAGQRIKRIGKRRINGLAFTVLGTGPALQEAALFANDLSRDTIETLRELAAPWSKNSTLIPTSVDKKGNVSGYIDFSFTNPYDYLRRPVAAVFNAINDGNERDLDGSKIAIDAVVGAATEMFGPFAEESIITERILDVTTREGVTETGRRVYKSEDTNKLGKIIAHLSDIVQPTVLTETIDIAEVEPKTGDVEFFEPGRLLAPFLKEEGLDNKGNRRMVAEEIIRQFTGMGEVKIDPKKAFLYKALEHNKIARQPQQNFNSQLRAFSRSFTGDRDPVDMIVENYREENERKFRIYNKAYRLVENMEKLGYKGAELREGARAATFSGGDEIVNGKFKALNIPLDDIEDIRKFYKENGRTFDSQGLKKRLQRLQREFNRYNLTAEGAEGEGEGMPSFELSRRVQEPEVEVSAVESSSATATPGAALGAAPVQTAQASNAAATISDPRTRDLFERLRGVG